MRTCPKCGLEVEDDSLYCPRDGTSLGAPPRPASLVGKVVADRYRVLKLLGRGGMGEVYLAEHVRMSRLSALKFIRGAALVSDDALQRFNREAMNTSRISHPNVVQIYDFGDTADGMTFLAMEYVDGTTLSQVLATDGVIPTERALNIARQVAEALGAAHGLGIVHRDLKPENVMLARQRDGLDLVKVVDFGISKAVQAPDQKLTATGMLVGTIDYMSPEQFLLAELDARSDIYSFGILVFRMLTGKLPLPAENAYAAREIRVNGQPLRLSEARPGIRWPNELQRVFDRVLARAPRDRYEHAVDFARDLEAAFNSVGVTSGVAEALSSSSLPVTSPPSDALPASAPARAAASYAETTPVAVADPSNETRPSLAVPVAAAAPRPVPAAASELAAPTRRKSSWMALFSLGGTRFRFELRVAVAMAVFVLVAGIGWLRQWSTGSGRLASNDATGGVAAVPPTLAAPTPPATDTSALGTSSPAIDSTGKRTAATPLPPTGTTGSHTAESPEVLRALAHAERLTDTSATDAQAREALGILRTLHPQTKEGRVEAKYRAFEANFRLDRTAETCRLYRELLTEARGTRFEASIGFFASIARQECAPR